MEILDKITELKRFSLLQGLSDSEFQILAESVEERTFQTGDFVFHENDTSSEVYFIYSGQLEICRDLPGEATPQRLTVLSAGSEVGELALVDGSPRSASARALEKTMVFVMDIHRLPITLMLLSRLISNIALSGARKIRQQETAVVNETGNTENRQVQELRQFSLMEGLSANELQALVTTMEPRKLASGDYLFHENEKSSEVYFIRSGSFAVSKSDSTGNEQVLATLGKGREVGELALLDGAPRSASVCAMEESEVYVLHTSKLPKNLMLLSRLIRNITLAEADKLRRTNVDHVQSLERELASARLRNEFGQFFIYILTVFSIGTMVNYLLHTYLQSLNVYGELFKWGYLAVLLFPTILVIWKMKIPFADLGVTRKNWKKSTVEGVASSAIFTVLFFSLLAIARYLNILPDKPLQLNLWGILPYAFHSYMQELLARGVLQSSFERFFDDTRGMKAVLLTAGLFGLFHIHFGLVAVFLTMLTSVMFGVLYLRHHNLIGVTLLHTLLGVCAFSSGIL